MMTKLKVHGEEVVNLSNLQSANTDSLDFLLRKS